jgi:hypothetical protein
MAIKKTTTLRPYRWEDRESIWGKTYQSRSGRVMRMVSRVTCVKGVFFVDGIKADKLLEKYIWLDGSPCGIEVKGFSNGEVKGAQGANGSNQHGDIPACGLGGAVSQLGQPGGADVL